jgi:hypothetical protein
LNVVRVKPETVNATNKAHAHQVQRALRVARVTMANMEFPEIGDRAALPALMLQARPSSLNRASDAHLDRKANQVEPAIPAELVKRDTSAPQAEMATMATWDQSARQARQAKKHRMVDQAEKEHRVPMPQSVPKVRTVPLAILDLLAQLVHRAIKALTLAQAVQAVQDRRVRPAIQATMGRRANPVPKV